MTELQRCLTQVGIVIVAIDDAYHLVQNLNLQPGQELDAGQILYSLTEARHQLCALFPPRQPKAPQPTTPPEVRSELIEALVAPHEDGFPVGGVDVLLVDRDNPQHPFDLKNSWET
jgi:hypothetical protein